MKKRLVHGVRTLASGFVVAVILTGAGTGSARAQEARPAVAIVVHPDTDVEDLTFSELKNIFRAERQFWDDRKRVTLLMRAPVANERELILERIYGMDESEFREYWIGKMFRAEIAAGPKLVYSAGMARDLVTVIPGAITFVPLNEVSAESKIVRIDGKLPGEEGYPLNR